MSKRTGRIIIYGSFLFCVSMCILIMILYFPN